MVVEARFIMEPEDWLAYQQQQAGAPDIFQITLSPLTRSLIFTVGTTNLGRNRRQVSGYNIHFIPASLASSSTIYSLEGTQSAFKLSDIVLSVGAPGPGGVASASSESLYGKAGFYFAAPIMQNGQESRYFSGPKPAPIPGDIVTTSAPPEISDPALVVTTETVNNRSVRKLLFSGVVPSVGKGVVAVVVVNVGSGYTPNTTLPVTFTGSSGSGAQATAMVAPNGTVQSVVVATTGTGYFTEPSATVTGSATLQAVVADAQAFAGYQIHMDGYFGGVLVESQLITGGNAAFPGSTLSGFFYLLPDTPPTGGPLTFYYVSVSPTGAQRTDPTSSPSVTLAGGLT